MRRWRHWRDRKTSDETQVRVSYLDLEGQEHRVTACMEGAAGGALMRVLAGWTRNGGLYRGVVATQHDITDELTEDVIGEIEARAKEAWEHREEQERMEGQEAEA